LRRGAGGEVTQTSKVFPATAYADDGCSFGASHKLFSHIKHYYRTIIPDYFVSLHRHHQKIKIMAAAQIIKQKYDIISYVTGLDNKNSIQELYDWIMTKEKEDVVQLSSEQTDMLLMSENDIRNGRVVSEYDLNKSDEQWFS
jgi:hypothetical protein